MHGVFVKAMSNHPILLSGVQWSGVHVSSINKCVAVLAVCEAPQSQPHSILCALSCRSQGLLCFSTLDQSFSDKTSSAVATCVQTMPQLRTLHVAWINPLPVLKSLSHRGSPLDSVTVGDPPLVCTVYTYSHATSVLVT